MKKFTKSNKLAKEIYDAGATGKWDKNESIGEAIHIFADDYHNRKLKEVSREDLLTILEIHGTRLHKSGGTGSLMVWDRAVSLIHKIFGIWKE